MMIAIGPNRYPPTSPRDREKSLRMMVDSVKSKRMTPPIRLIKAGTFSLLSLGESPRSSYFRLKRPFAIKNNEMQIRPVKGLFGRLRRMQRMTPEQPRVKYPTQGFLAILYPPSAAHRMKCLN